MKFLGCFPRKSTESKGNKKRASRVLEAENSGDGGLPPAEESLVRTYSPEEQSSAAAAGGHTTHTSKVVAYNINDNFAATGADGDAQQSSADADAVPNGDESAAAGDGDDPESFVGSRTVTSGNKTVETVTYKREKAGQMETHVEHIITIHSAGDDIDHDAALSAAIMEATKMNPDMTVEQIKVKQESQC